jgi:hypothetical protein
MWVLPASAVQGPPGTGSPTDAHRPFTPAHVTTAVQH